VIHTGAGSSTIESLGDRAGAMRSAMAAALTAGHAILAAGGSSLDAVETAVVVLEDEPEFNAGKGAVYTHDGTHELDAAIMDGRTMMAGAVAAVTHVKNPIRLARLVMDRSPHVLLVGDGAEAFGRAQGGVEFVPERYFDTELRWQQLQRALETEGTKQGAVLTPVRSQVDAEEYFGTVGAVALDRHGNLAAATSTGGITNKRAGRVGDSPLIGAGTYASNRSCAISGTGIGEYFVRFVVAKDICARVEYLGIGAQAAADDVVHGVLKSAGGSGGVVGLDREGAMIMSFNTTGMGRGYVGADGQATIRLTAGQ
jgi:beta-aspartyl-peptidase (threonine type)